MGEGNFLIDSVNKPLRVAKGRHGCHGYVSIMTADAEWRETFPVSV